MLARFINVRKRLREKEKGQYFDAVNKRFLHKLKSPDLTQVMPPQPQQEKKLSPLNMAGNFFVVFMIFVVIMTALLGSAEWGMFIVLPFVFLIFWGAFWYSTITNPRTERILRDLRR